MRNYKDIPLKTKVIAIAGIAIIGAYFLNLQRKYPILTSDVPLTENARVVSIEENFYRCDLGSSLTYDIKIEGEEREIRFRPSDWDSTVEEGDTIDLRVREVPWFVHGGRLKGISIDDHKEF